MWNSCLCYSHCIKKLLLGTCVPRCIRVLHLWIFLYSFGSSRYMCACAHFDFTAWSNSTKTRGKLKQVLFAEKSGKIFSKWNPFKHFYNFKIIFMIFFDSSTPAFSIEYAK